MELQQCKSFNSHLLNKIIQLEGNSVINCQYSRRGTIEVNSVKTKDDVLEASVCKALSLTGVVNIAPENLHAYHRMKRLGRVIIKFKCCKQKQSVICINARI